MLSLFEELGQELVRRDAGGARAIERVRHIIRHEQRHATRVVKKHGSRAVDLLPGHHLAHLQATT
jgi:hypothetical protein